MSTANHLTVVAPGVGDLQDLADAARPLVVVRGRGQRRGRAVGRVADDRRLVVPDEAVVDRVLGLRDVVGVERGARRRGVHRVVVGGLDHAVVARRELQRLVVTLVDQRAVRRAGALAAAGADRAEARLEADLRLDRARGQVQHAVGARLERVGDDALAVPAVVGGVAGGGVEHVGDRAGALREDRGAANVLDPPEDLLTGLEEVLLDADVRGRGGGAEPVVLVGARRPHEVPTVGVDVVHELDVRERVRDPLLVAGLGLGVLARAGVEVARALGRRAEVAVEQRVLAAVAVHVDAPGRRARPGRSCPWSGSS